MIRARISIVLLSSLWLFPVVLDAQELDRYRDARLGSSLVAVATANGLTPADAKSVHQRPAIIQDLEWRSPRFLSASVATDDPVSQVVFTFYNDQLFRIVVGYDRQRTEGLTDADLIETLSATYGSPSALAGTSRKPRVSESSEDRDPATVIARWENPESSVTLLRQSYPTPVSLVVLSKRLAYHARAAATEGARLDRIEAPQRELDRRRQEADAVRVSGENARPANKAKFKP